MKDAAAIVHGHDTTLRVVPVRSRSWCPSVRSTLVATLAIVVVSSGCLRSSSDDFQRGTTIDTIGRRIIVQNLEDPVGRPIHDLRGQPLLVLRDAKGRAAEFEQVWGILTLGDSTYVLDGKAPAISVFDESGAWHRRIGRPGQGPGEYIWPTAFAAVGDTLLVWDLALRRLNAFDLAGGPLNSRLLPNSAGVSRIYSHPRLGPLFQLGPRWQSPPDSLNGVLRVAILDSIGQPSRILLRAADSSTVASVRPGSSSAASVPNAPRPVWAVTQQGTILFGGGAEYELIGLDDRGDTILSIRREFSPMLLSPAELRVARDKVASYEQALRDQVRLPDRRPAVTRLVPTSDGCVWVATSDRRYSNARRWDVFDGRTGALREALVLDSAFDVEAVGRHAVAIATRDSLDVAIVGLLPNPTRCASIVRQ